MIELLRRPSDRTRDLGAGQQWRIRSARQFFQTQSPSYRLHSRRLCLTSWRRSGTLYFGRRPINGLIGITQSAIGAPVNAATLQVLPTKLTTTQALQILSQQGSQIQGLLISGRRHHFTERASQDCRRDLGARSIPTSSFPTRSRLALVFNGVALDIAIDADFIFRRYLHTFFRRDRTMFNPPHRCAARSSRHALPLNASILPRSV